MPRPLSPHGTTNRWRTGCDCDPCTVAHNADTTTWRRQKARERLDPIRTALIHRVAAGVPLTQACTELEVSVVAVHGRAQWDPQWSQDLDAALMVGRDPGLDHGTEGAYRRGKCRCPECREGHNAGA